jgi:hypothetical protein
MTATPPRADLRTLATLAAHDVDCPDGPNCREDLTTDGRYGRYADAVLAAVLPEHRRMVLDEAAEAIELAEGRRCPECRGKPASLKWNRSYEREGRCGCGHRWTVRRGDWTDPVALLRRLAAAAPSAEALWTEAVYGEHLAELVDRAAAPPAGLSASAPAETASEVPEGGMGACDRCTGLFLPGDKIAYDADGQYHAEHFPAVPEEADGQRPGEGDALTYAEMEADRDRLAAQVTQFRRVVEAAKAWRGNRYASASILELAAAVDALHEAEPHQHECACNRNWGGPCGPCVCEEPPRQGVWRLTCGAGNIPPNQTYATRGAAEDVMRLHDGACPGTHGVEFVPDADVDQTEDDRG